jgi:hypothetical protein
VTILNDDGVAFTDDPLVVGTTLVRVVHVGELRSRIDAQRLGRGLSAYPWSGGMTAGGIVLAAHVSELRTALGQAYTAAGQTPPVYTDPGLTAGTTIRAVHIAELRANVVTLESLP